MENKGNQEKQYKAIANYAIEGRLIRAKDNSLLGICTRLIHNSNGLDYVYINNIDTGKDKYLFETIIEEIPSKVYTIDDLKVGMKIQTGRFNIEIIEEIFRFEIRFKSDSYTRSIFSILQMLNSNKWSILEKVHKDLFPEKTAKTNEIIRKHGIPEQIKDKTNAKQEFNEERFEAYINKFSMEDKRKALKLLALNMSKNGFYFTKYEIDIDYLNSL